MIFHAQKRAAERHNLDLSVMDIRAMEADIASGFARRVKRAGGGRMIALVQCPGANRMVPVVYESQTGKIVTVLPECAKERPARYRERDDVESGEESEPEDYPPVHESAPNNILAEALERALAERR